MRDLLQNLLINLSKIDSCRRKIRFLNSDYCGLTITNMPSVFKQNLHKTTTPNLPFSPCKKKNILAYGTRYSSPLIRVDQSIAKTSPSANPVVPCMSPKKT